MKDALFVAVKDLRYMLKARETLLWVFVMPIVFFYFIGTVTSGFGPGGEGRRRLALEVGEEPGFLLERLEARLAERGYELVRPAADGTDAPRRSLAVPARLTERALAGEETELVLARDGDDALGDVDALRVGRAVYTVVADLAALAAADREPSPEALAELDATPRALALDVTAAGERRRIPTGFEQTIPGTMVMFTLLVLVTSGAVLLVIERRQGVLRRLAATPIRRGSVVLGKWAGKLALGLVQVAFAMLAGTVIFGMDWGPSFGAVCLVMATYAGFMASVGLLVGCVARTEGVAVALGVLAANVLAALGGCWWPIEVTPPWMQRLALFLPTGWAMDALHALISFGAAPATVLPHVAGFVLGALLLGWLATRAFRYS